MNRNISKNLKNIDKNLKIIYGKLSFFAINPINTAKEKEKFFKKQYKKVSYYKPKSLRKESSEIFIVAKNLIG